METIPKRRSRTDEPIRPHIVDEEMIPNAREAALLHKELALHEDVNEEDNINTQKKKKQYWPNRVIYICVAIIVLCFIVISVYYWWRSCSDEPVTNPRQPQQRKSRLPTDNTIQFPPNHQQQQQQQQVANPNDEWDKYQQSVNDNQLKQYIKKKPTVSSAQHIQRKAIVEDTKLEQIPEESNGATDGNDDETRTLFTNQLTSQVNNKPTTDSVDSHVVDIDSISTGSSEQCNDEYDDETAECNFVLTSGKNKGKPCGGSCAVGEFRCTRHIKK